MFFFFFLTLWLVCHFTIPEIYRFKIALQQIDGDLNLITTAGWAQTEMPMSSLLISNSVYDFNSVWCLGGSYCLLWRTGPEVLLPEEDLICGSRKGSQCHLNQFIYSSCPVSTGNQWKALMSAPHLPPSIFPPPWDLHAQGFWNLLHQDLSQSPVARGQHGEGNEPVSCQALWLFSEPLARDQCQKQGNINT